MDHPRSDHSEPSNESRHEEQRTSAWERALSGPPINPNSEVIYHDGRTLQARHA